MKAGLRSRSERGDGKRSMEARRPVEGEWQSPMDANLRGGEERGPRWGARRGGALSKDRPVYDERRGGEETSVARLVGEPSGDNHVTPSL